MSVEPLSEQDITKEGDSIYTYPDGTVDSDWVRVDRLKELFAELKTERNIYENTVEWEDIERLFKPLLEETK